MTPEEVCRQLCEGEPALFECSQAPKEGVRVRTPFLYPDGEVIDVFVVERGGSVQVTDFGEALGWLRTQLPAGRLSPKQTRLLDDVCLTLGVEMFRGQLVARVRDGDLRSAVLGVAQAALRAADLWFTMRIRSVESVADEVADWLTEKAIPFERNAVHLGRSGRKWIVDYQTYVPTRTSLVFLLATGSRGAAAGLVKHVLAGLYDLCHLKVVQPQLAFVSLFDDTVDVWREEDYRLVADLSWVARWSRPDEFEAFLRAA